MTPQELSRLDYEGASEMLIAYATDAKKYEKEIATLKAQSSDWKAKATLAQTKNMPDLAQAALQRAAEIDTKSRELELEVSGIRRDIEDLRSALPILKAKQRRIDPDQLLAELSMIVGSEDNQFDTRLAQGGTTSSMGGPHGGPESGSQGGAAPSQAGSAGAAQSTDKKVQGGAVETPKPVGPSTTSQDDALAELKRKMGLL